MSDWEDDDWEATPAPSFANKLATKKVEEDLAAIEEREREAAAALATAENLKKAALLNESQFQNKLKSNKLKNETESERKLREKKEIEDAEIDAAADMFGMKTTISTTKSSSSTGGLGSIPLKTQADHTNFGKLLKERFETNKSSGFHLVSFYKSLNNVLKDSSISAKNLDDIIETINKIKATKSSSTVASTSSAPAANSNLKSAPLAATSKRSKKEIQEEQDKLASMYGGGDYEDKYDEYGDNYDFF